MAIGQSYPQPHWKDRVSHRGKVYSPHFHLKIKLTTTPSSYQGIGFHTAYQLAAHGAKVYIGARSAEKADDAIQHMISNNPSIGADKLHSFVADLGDLKSVSAATQRFLDKESRLDILVHNAAMYA